MMSLDTKPQQYFVRFEISIKDVNDVALLALTDTSSMTPTLEAVYDMMK